MSRLKALSQLEFELLYNTMTIAALAKELDIDECPLYKRARKYKLSRKPLGRPVEKVVFKGESFEKYPPEIKELLIKTLITDGFSDEKLKKHGYSEDYIETMREKYDTNFVDKIIDKYVKNQENIVNDK